MKKQALDNLAIVIFGMSKEEAHMKGICIDCKEPAMHHCHTSDGILEYENSGLCEECFDRIMEMQADLCLYNHESDK